MNSTKQIIRECLMDCRAQWSAWLKCRHCTEAEIELAKLKIMLIDGALEEISQSDPAGESEVSGNDPAGKLPVEAA